MFLLHLCKIERTIEKEQKQKQYRNINNLSRVLEMQKYVTYLKK